MVISAFPAIGKTYFCEKYPDRAIDLECMPFKYSNYYEKLVDSEKEAIKAEYSLELRRGWEVEYFEAIKAMEKATPNLYIFIPPIYKVLEMLKAAGIRYTRIYPKRSLLQEYILRCRNRGNTEDFIDVLTTCWDSWVNDVKSDDWADKIELSAGQYLADVVKSVANDYSAEYLPSNL